MKKTLERLAYIGLGCLLTLIGYNFGTMQSSSIHAQSESKPTVVEEIVCRRLRIVDTQGNTVVIGDGDQFLHKLKLVDAQDNTLVGLGTNGYGGGLISVKDPEEIGGAVSIFTDNSGGRVSVLGKDRRNEVRLRISDFGGNLSVQGKDGKTGAELSIGAESGFVSAHDKDGGVAQLFVNEYGGGVAIFNKGGKNVGQFSVGDRGDGIIRLRDKFGYRTGNLP